MKLVKFKKKCRPQRWRLLRNYRRVAQKLYPCWSCPHPIEAGDEYTGEVWVREKMLRVMCFHINCPGGRYDEEEESAIETLEEDISSVA